MCKCADVRILLNDWIKKFAHLHICTFAHWFLLCAKKT